MEVALDEFLRNNEITLGKHSRFNPFYTRASHSSGSPVKRESQQATTSATTTTTTTTPSSSTGGANTSATSDGETRAVAPKPRSRRVTKPAAEESLSQTLARTPARALASASSIPLPPSPAVIADAVDRRTASLRRRMSSAYASTGLTPAAHSWRDALSTVSAINLVLLGSELWGLRTEVLPSRYAFTIPALLSTPAFLAHDTPLYLPDLFHILTSRFWGPVWVWSLVGLLLPAAVAWSFNLGLKHSSRRSSSTVPPVYSLTAAAGAGAGAAIEVAVATAPGVDPLIFNLAKAVLTWAVYTRGVRLLGLLGDESVARVQAALPAGEVGVLIGAGVGVVVSLYDAVLSK